MGAELLITKVQHRSWMTMVQQQSSSGLSVAEWCSQNQISTKTFYYRRKQLRAEILQSNTPVFAEVNSAEPALPGFEQSSDFRMQLTITLNGVTIGVSEGTSRQLLTDVLQVIRNA